MDIKTGEFTSGPQRKNITVFFSDIRGFTSFSEKNDPLIVVNRLNELFDVQVKIIARNQAEAWRHFVQKIMHRHGWKEGPWFYKGAKACLMWPMWHDAFPDAKWISPFSRARVRLAMAGMKGTIILSKTAFPLQ